ncbi:PEP-CTERM sorting domain-containing protein [Botrimarina hoheduenensis]|nr:PEP-CTERM sorting domain-containing protein [Botrimarina hoheduenensis]
MAVVTSAPAAIVYVGPDEGPDGPGGMTGWMGADAWFGQVTESNDEGPGGSDAMLFGAPTSVSGNSLDFSPTGFLASVNSTGPLVSEIVDSQLSMMIVAKPGKVLDNLRFTEAGDTTLAGNPASFTTASSVTNEVFIDVVEVDGMPISGFNIQAQMTFTPSGGTYSMAQDSNGFPIFSTDWSGSVDVDIAQALLNEGIAFQFGVTKINVTLDNTLTAVASDGGSSFIKKKDFDGLIITTNIPEPSSLALLALAGLAARRRR